MDVVRTSICATCLALGPHPLVTECLTRSHPTPLQRPQPVLTLLLMHTLSSLQELGWKRSQYALTLLSMHTL